MATDPYHTFAADLRSSLDQARQLSQRYQALQVQRNREAKSSSTYPQSPSNYRDNVDTQLHDTYNQLQEQLETIENDINDVQESVEMLEKRGPALFNVDSAELGRRKRFVQSCTDEVRKLEKTLQEEARKKRKDFHSIDVHNTNFDEDDEDANVAFEMEQQQQLMSTQDNTLDLIGNTLFGLKKQAGILGQEIGEQVELIGALDTEVDTSQSKLARAVGRMDDLVRRSDDRMGGWCVWLLIGLLFVFLLIAILV